MKCSRCGKEVDIDRQEMYGVYIYPKSQIDLRKNRLPSPKGLNVSEGDFKRLLKSSYCKDCATAISGYCKTIDYSTRYDAQKARNLSKNGWTLEDIAIDLNCPKDAVYELIRHDNND